MKSYTNHEIVAMVVGIDFSYPLLVGYLGRNIPNNICLMELINSGMN